MNGFNLHLAALIFLHLVFFFLFFRCFKAVEYLCVSRREKEAVLSDDDMTTYDVDALVLLQSESASDPVEADSPEIEILDPDDEAPVVAMSADKPEDVPWMCHSCSFLLSSSDGLICSICYRSTCAHCVQPTANRIDREAPVCKACAQGAVG